MPRPRVVVTVSGNMERSLRTEEYTAALAVEAQNSQFNPNSSSVVKTADTAKRVRHTPQCSSLDKPELD